MGHNCLHVRFFLLDLDSDLDLRSVDLDLDLDLPSLKRTWTWTLLLLDLLQVWIALFTCVLNEDEFNSGILARKAVIVNDVYFCLIMVVPEIGRLNEFIFTVILRYIAQILGSIPSFLAIVNLLADALN